MYNQLSNATSWEIKRNDIDGDFAVFKAYRELDWEAPCYIESICLQEGEYGFTIYAFGGDSISCGGGGGH